MKKFFIFIFTLLMLSVCIHSEAAIANNPETSEATYGTFYSPRSGLYTTWYRNTDSNDWQTTVDDPNLSLMMDVPGLYTSIILADHRSQHFLRMFDVSFGDIAVLEFDGTVSYYVAVDIFIASVDAYDFYDSDGQYVLMGNRGDLICYTCTPDNVYRLIIVWDRYFDDVPESWNMYMLPPETQPEQPSTEYEEPEATEPAPTEPTEQSTQPSEQEEPVEQATQPSESEEPTEQVTEPSTQEEPTEQATEPSVQEEPTEQAVESSTQEEPTEHDCEPKPHAFVRFLSKIIRTIVRIITRK